MRTELRTLRFQHDDVENDLVFTYRMLSVPPDNEVTEDEFMQWIVRTAVESPRLSERDIMQMSGVVLNTLFKAITEGLTDGT